MDIVFDKLKLYKAPFSGKFVLCLSAKAGESSGTCQLKGMKPARKDKDLKLDLRLADIIAGQTCTFECSLNTEKLPRNGSMVVDRISGKFVVREKGIATYNIGNIWCYSIHWHTEEKEDIA